MLLVLLLFADFWTTKCTRCPEALDKLQLMSQQYPQIIFLSICCDSLDGAREILERDEELKWQGIQHYYMATEYKEQAKMVFGFKTVPFYVFVNAQGTITQTGGPSNIDFNNLPGTTYSSTSTSTPSTPTSTTNSNFGMDTMDKENEAYNTNIRKQTEEPAVPTKLQVDVVPEFASLDTEESLFVIDDLDF
jgi:thiol-disulfide isomerase/thioredoxin